MKKIITILLIGLFLTGCSLQPKVITKQNLPVQQIQTSEIMLGADSGALSPGTMADDATVGTVAWTNPNNAKASDNVYVTAVSGSGTWSSHYLKATNFGFAIPTGATINGILVEIEKGTDFSSFAFADNSIKVVKSNGSFSTTDKATATNWLATDTYVTSGSSSELWREIWTAEDINNSNFGVGVSVKKTSAGSTYTARVDHIRITVYYTEAAPANTCTYSGSGDWNVQQSDSCYITSNVYVNGAVNLIGGTGMLDCAPGVKISAHGWNFGTQAGNTKVNANCIQSHN